MRIRHGGSGMEDERQRVICGNKRGETAFYGRQPSTVNPSLTLTCMLTRSCVGA